MTASTSIDKDLETLLTAIKNLPTFAQSGRRDDPLGKYLTPGLTKGNNPKPACPSHKDGAYFAFNQEWERAFQKQPGDPDDKLQKPVSHGRGKHGLILAHACAEHYATVAKPDERNLIQLRVQTLRNLLNKFNYDNGFITAALVPLVRSSSATIPILARKRRTTAQMKWKYVIILE
ncbi:hypothetical protein B0H14DRAFT_2577042 [Mycena olivaceomarginata]|nr:hypothetical protein B0H14DRAFT_2577042 [Mycena olivaceomarginata]